MQGAAPSAPAEQQDQIACSESRANDARKPLPPHAAAFLKKRQGREEAHNTRLTNERHSPAWAAAAGAPRAKGEKKRAALFSCFARAPRAARGAAPGRHPPPDSRVPLPLSTPPRAPEGAFFP